MRGQSSPKSGFTLIELSIVLVIIGLIVGGVLVGQDLIRAAAVRATISQIESYNTAVNTFQAKYDALPGDISATNAIAFGLSPSLAFRTTTGITFGNGNGILESYYGTGHASGGETSLFWADLAAASLIADMPKNSTDSQTCSATAGILCVVPAKVGQGNFVYVMSGGCFATACQVGPWVSNGINYFGLSAAPAYVGGGNDISNPGITVAQAYAIDAKMDDGLPQSGRVIAAYENLETVNPNPIGYGGDYGIPAWVNPGGRAVVDGVTTTATAGSSTTCYDNGNNAADAMQYSMTQNGGAGVNCALSFQFQ